MNSSEYFEFVEQEQKKLITLMRAKNADYTAGAGPFANFHASEDFGIEPLLGLFLRMSDKFQRLKSFSKNGQLQVGGESVEDAVNDIIGYGYLALGLLEERKAK